MRIAYLDCSSGMSGDMFLGAMLDAGLPSERLLGELQKIPLGPYDFKVTRVRRSSLMGTRVEIVAPQDQPERHLVDIEHLLAQSALAAATKERALRVFTRLADVEGKLHGQPPSHVHFHEVGAIDAILDVVGACAGLEFLQISDLLCSPLNVGGGRVTAAHGSLPVPAPATAELLKGIPIYSSGLEAELVTPTGAAIVSTLTAGFGPMPWMRAESIGYGAGAKDFHGHPNLLRLFLGHSVEAPNADELVSVIEANVDDMSPQLYGYLADRALSTGALDITCSSVQMKKNRPGLLISVLCRPEKANELTELLFSETTTIGVRSYEARRRVLKREWVSVDTEFGVVRVKVARHNGTVVNAAPEYEDCQRLASEKSVPLKQVMLAAQLAYQRRDK